MNVLITGANRGIGLAFTKHYLQQGHKVWACHRADAGDLTAIESLQLTCLNWDIADYPSSQTLQQLPDRIGLLINNAGIYGMGKMEGQSLDTITPESMLHVFDIDCVGALRVVQSVKDRIILGKGVIANISSKMGSSDDNTSGGCYAYRAAKAALCIVSKSMAVDLEPKGVRVITLHPGWVKTDMTGNTGEIDTQTSVDGMCRVIDNIDQYDLGGFVAWDGEVVPF